MHKWKILRLPEVEKDLRSLDRSQQLLVFKAVDKVAQNPVSIFEGGYGKPLGNKNGTDLSGLFKIKLRASGIRIVYKLIKADDAMLLVIVGMRADDAVYQEAEKRAQKHRL